ncbi:Nuclease precursor [Bremerella volcania]|uniref:Nuclease n=1 Tax=Bremerella volcania TaxID=2527984 RepID=A0A518C752_9BACT|nr:DNA/RNA non-specific endonuclease [Bremerella volcania]QDU75055.1 Nuclease precursor [Bremerella volcania]
MDADKSLSVVNQNAITISVPLNITISLGGMPTAPPVTGKVSPSAVAAPQEKVPVMAPNLGERKGYQANFLSFGEVPLPELTDEGMKNVAKLEDGSHVLHYTKFSLVMHKKRRLAMFTAANVDWRDEKRKINGKKPTRKKLNGFTGNEREDWVTDPRILFDHQLPDHFFMKDGGAFDRGHLVRRDDVAWGDSFKEMQNGNGDTFHTTNCSPQVADFNQSRFSDFNWGALENMVQKQSKTERVCVLAGPVFSEDDKFFDGFVKSGVPVSVQIPEAYWKIIIAQENGHPQAYGFILDQDLAPVNLHAEFVVPDAWKNLMVPIQEIEDLMGGLFSFGIIKQWDQHEDA